MNGDQDTAAAMLTGVAAARRSGTGRGWASVAFGLGVAVSVAANVAHTYYIPGAGRPPVGAQLAAAFYPCALLLVVEILARVPWPSSPWWGAARYGGASAVAGVAAVVSYRHMSALLSAYGEDRLTSAIGPLAVDGLMVVASFALLAIGRQTHADTAPTARRATTPAPVADAPADVDQAAENEVPAEPVSTTPAEDDQPDQAPVQGLGEAVRSARAAGRSVRWIADEFGLTRYRVGKLLAEPMSATPAAVNGHVRQTLDECTGLGPSPGGTVGS